MSRSPLSLHSATEVQVRIPTGSTGKRFRHSKLEYRVLQFRIPTNFGIPRWILFSASNSRTRSGREDLTGSLAGVAAAPAVRLQVGARAGKVECRQTPRIWGNPAPAASTTAAFLGGEGGGAGGRRASRLFSLPPTHPGRKIVETRRLLKGAPDSVLNISPTSIFSDLV